MKLNKNFWYIRQSIHTLRKYCLKSFVLLIVGEATLTFFPIFLIYANKNLISSIVAFSDFNSLLIPILFFVIILFSQNLITNYFRKYVINFKLITQFEKEIKLHLFEIYSRFKIDDFDSAELNNESIRAKNASINLFRIAQISVEIFFSILGVFSISNIITTINKNLFIILFLIVLSTILEKIISIINTAKFIKNKTQTEKEYDEYKNYILNPTSLIEIVNFDAFDYFFSKIESYSKTLEKKEIRKNHIDLLISIFLKTISAILKIFGYYFLFKLFSSNKINLISFSIIISSFNIIDSYTSNIFSEFSMITQFIVLTKPYFDYEKKSNENKKNENLIIKSENLILKNIYYKYKNQKNYALKNINLIINEGEKIAIVGENGSGKSTLGKIILKQILPVSGDIYIDDKKLKTNNVFSNFSIIPQDFNIYNISIKENLLFENNYDDYFILDKLEKRGLCFDLEGLHKIYGKEYGGLNLSHGQKQRLAILRGVLKEAKLIVLDEPSSALDSIEEKRIFNNFFSEYSKKTIIFITHNLSFAKNADKIIVMKNGEILESGDYEQLSKDNKSEFFKLWETQKNLIHHKNKSAN